MKLLLLFCLLILWSGLTQAQNRYLHEPVLSDQVYIRKSSSVKKPLFMFSSFIVPGSGQLLAGFPLRSAAFMFIPVAAMGYYSQMKYMNNQTIVSSFAPVTAACLVSMVWSSIDAACLADYTRIHKRKSRLKCVGLSPLCAPFPSGKQMLNGIYLSINF